MSLFPQTHAASSSTGAGAGNGTTLLSFKAGKIDLDGPKANGCYKATPDLRKGTVSLVRTNDQLVHFRWADRTSGAIEDDRILFPDEISFKKVKTGKDADRVYMVKYSSGAEPMMFWMQEKESDKDEENSTKINQYANDPAAATAAAAVAVDNAPSSATAAAAVPGANDSTTSDGDALSALLASLNPGAGSPGSGSSPALSAEAFRNIMSHAAAPPAAPAPAPAPATTHTATNAAIEQSVNSPQPVELQEVLGANGVLATGLLEDAAVVDQLISQLPEGQRTRADLEAALRSPQLSDSMRALSAALQSENYNAVMANFGLDPSAGMSALMRGEAVEAFINAVQSMADSTPEGPGGSSNAGASGNNGDDMNTSSE
jgi:hypothetical protein